jgi:hypothetical protein
MIVGITLVTNVYVVGVSDRRAGELLGALRMNIENPSVEEVHLFVEDKQSAFLSETAPGARAAKTGELLRHKKVRVVQHGKRAILGEFFSYINKLPAGRVVALANADIGFEDASMSFSGVSWEKLFLAVSRRDVWRPSAAQDAWIFRTPIHPAFEDIGKWNWTLGKGGCDHRIAYEAARSGYRVINPSISVAMKHFHLSGERTYSKADNVPPPYGFVFPTDLRVCAPPPAKAASVVTVRFDGEVPARTRRSAQEYAARCGADFVLLAPGDSLAPVFDNYEQVVYLSPDVLVCRGAENLFQLFPPKPLPATAGGLPGGILALSDDQAQTGRWTPERIVEKYGRYAYGRADLWGGVNWNTAVMVADRFHAWLFDKPPSVFARRPGIIPSELPKGPLHQDPAYLSAVIRKVEVDVQLLPLKYNFMPFLSKVAIPEESVQFLNLEGGNEEAKMSLLREFSERGRA